MNLFFMKGTVAEKRFPRFTFLVLGVISIILLFLPTIIWGLKDAHDLRFHLSWFLSFGDALRSGELYPRWLPDQFAGLGSPVMLFYPPFTNFYFTAIDYLTFRTLSADRVMGIGAMVLSFISAWSFYVWSRAFVQRTFALVAAAFYAIAPYHLMIDLYNRGAMAEYAAYIWIPLIFAGIYHVLKKKDVRWKIILSLSIAGIFLTHLLTALLVAPVAAVYALIIIGKTEPISPKSILNRAFLLGIPAIIGVGLAAIYFIPALLLFDQINIDALHRFSLNEGFIYRAITHPSQKDHFLLKIFIIATIYLAISVYLIVSIFHARKRQNITIDGAPLFWLLTAIICYALMCGVFSFIFIKPSPYSEIQFTWRIMVIMEFAVISAAALALGNLAFSQTSKHSMIICSLSFLGLLAFQTIDIANKSRAMASKVSALEMEQVKLRLSSEEYYPKDAGFPLGMEAVPRLAPYQDAPLPGRIVEGRGKIEQIDQDGSSYFMKINMASPGTIVLHQFYFSGWRITDNEGNDFEAYPYGKDQLVSFQVSDGTKEIFIRRMMTVEERTGLMISLISLFFLILMPLITRKRESE